jgi:hypothetical protein
VIFRYVRLHDVERWMRCGWLPLDGLDGTHHGHWSVLMAWLCDCPMREPA